MRKLEVHVDLDALLGLKPRTAGEFCEGALDADVLVEELQEYGPFAPLRKNFCEFLGIGESTLTGWIKGGRVPRAAKVAYVLLVGLIRLQAEVERHRRDTHELKIVQDGKTFQLVWFEVDETGVSIGRIVARDIPDSKKARVLAGSLEAFKMLEETRYVIRNMLEHTENVQYIDDLRDLDTRIINKRLATFEPEKWREFFAPFDLNDFIPGARPREEPELNITLESDSNSDDQNDAGASRKRD